MYLQLNEEHNSGYQSVKVEITSLKKLSQPKNLFLVERGHYYKNGKQDEPIHTKLNILKVQFIAIAKLSVSNDDVMLAAFIDPGKGDIDFWLMNVPEGYEQEIQNATLVDYQGHLDVSALIGIKPKSFSEYIEDYDSDIIVY